MDILEYIFNVDCSVIDNVLLSLSCLLSLDLSLYIINAFFNLLFSGLKKTNGLKIVLFNKNKFYLSLTYLSL